MHWSESAMSMASCTVRQFATSRRMGVGKEDQGISATIMIKNGINDL